MTYRKFSDIENSYRTKTIEHIMEYGFSKGDWYVSEKVHGSQATLFYNNTDYRFGKRSDFVNEGENFFDYRTILTTHQDRVFALYADLKTKYTFTELFVYGELYGGRYSHPEVTKCNVSSVQKEIQYRPDQGFYAFDIRVDDTILNINEAIELFEKHGFFYAKTLFKGSFEDAMKYPNEFQTKIPEWLGLPPITDNMCEGVVLRPEKTCYFGNGARVILKNKNDKWKEKDADSKAPKLPKDDKISVSENADKVIAEINKYFNENRLKNVLSKFGPVEGKDFGKILSSYVTDGLTDFRKDGGDLVVLHDSLDEKEKKLCNKLVSTYAGSVIRKNFQNILDGNF